jgi:hypothetical protein
MFRLNRNKQKSNRNSFIGAYFAIFYRKFRVFPIFSFFFLFFGFFQFFLVCFETVCFGCFASIPKQKVSMLRLNRNKQLTHQNTLKESAYIWVFFRKFRVVSVCFGLLRGSVCFGCFDIGSKHRNKPKFFIFGFTKQTETNAKQILFRFVSVRNRNLFLFVSRTS